MDLQSMIAAMQGSHRFGIGVCTMILGCTMAPQAFSQSTLQPASMALVSPRPQALHSAVSLPAARTSTFVASSRDRRRPWSASAAQFEHDGVADLASRLNSAPRSAPAWRDALRFELSQRSQLVVRPRRGRVSIAIQSTL
jgi:hypothetical protein